jgi:hypothetical protein
MRGHHSFTGIKNNITKKLNVIRDHHPELKQAINNVAASTSAIHVGTTEEFYARQGGAVVNAVAEKTMDKSASPGSVGKRSTPGELEPGITPAPWANELEGFASMNCIVTLSVLSVDEVNDPDGTYRSSGLRNDSIIARSGGSGKFKVKTAYEKVLGKSLEFFIDDLEFMAICSPDINSRNANVTTLEFKIQEPYSMGLFLNALKAAATIGGHPNYIAATYMLTLEFVGTDEEGNVGQAPHSRRFLPIKFKTVEFQVTGAGSEYACSAYLSNEQALTDRVTQIKTDISITGSTVRELLQTGGQSLTTVINTRLLDKEENDELDTADQYVIIFPSSGEYDSNTKNSSRVVSTQNRAMQTADGPPGSTAVDFTLSKAELQKQYSSITGNTDDVPLNYDEYISQITGIVKSSSQFGKAFKDYANSDYAKNEVGESDIIANPGETGQSPMGQMKYAEELVNNIPIFSRGSAQLQTSSTNRMFKFLKGTRIQDIIEEVLLISTYGQNLATQLSDITDPMGMITWYRIETDVYIVPGSKEVLRSGNTPNIYVYRVVPYKVHSSIFNNPTAPAIGISELKSVAAKEYNYIYTGLNKDILDVDIKYKFAFQAGAIADSGALTASQRKGTANKSSADQTENDYKLSQGGTGNAPAEGIGGSYETINNTAMANGGSEISNADINIARGFNQRLVNSHADLLMMTMTIMGDPFYISDNGAGNYHVGGDNSYTNMTKDGTANYSNGQLHINLLFRTPVDINEDTGGYIYPEDLLLVESFSGIYSVIRVESSISGNKFTQVLTMNRVINQQETQTTAGAAKFEESFGSESPGWRERMNKLGGVSQMAPGGSTSTIAGSGPAGQYVPIVTPEALKEAADLRKQVALNRAGAIYTDGRPR